VAAALANGSALETVGPAVDDMEMLDYEPGMIVSIDRFGNAITDLEPPAGEFALEIGEITLDRLFRTYDEGGKDPFLIVGSSGLVEISVRNGSAAAMLHLERGDRVQVISREA
jgi:S-adenosylmethionine hydrolase